MITPTNDIRIATMVNVPLERYDELIRKEFAYDYMRRDVLKRGFTTEHEKLLFNISDEEVKEDR